MATSLLTRRKTSPSADDKCYEWKADPMNSMNPGRDFECYDRSLLLVDDDEILTRVLERALSTRGFDVTQATTVDDALHAIALAPPAYAVIDLSIAGRSGLDVAGALNQARPDAHFIIMSGFGTLETAVAAAKLGAVDYLVKPARIDDIIAALRPGAVVAPAEPDALLTPDRVRWEHIRSVFTQCEQNVSETARRLSMHRRTLQRVLGRGAPA